MRWCRSAVPSWRSANSTASEDVLLGSGLLLLKRCSPCFDQSTLDTASNFWRKNGPGVEGTRNRLLPGFEHLIQLLARLRIDQCVGVHKGLIQIATQEQSVGRAYVLDNRIDYIQGGQLLSRRSLQSRLELVSSQRETTDGLCVSSCPTRPNRWYSESVSPTVRMWFSNTREMAIACSVFSLAMTVRLLI